MKDPILAAHELAPLLFDLSGPMFPISIRDQMLRASLLIDRAVEEKLIGNGRPLLVIGAGAAGVSAAIRAAQFGVTTFLVERREKAFSRQSDRCTRVVDPAQYDWPAGHWDCGAFPPAQANDWRTRAPLPWTTMSANKLAAHWQELLNCALIEFPRTLKVYYNVQIDDFDRHKDLIRFTLEWPGHGVARLDFGMALACVGAGHERCSVGDFTSTAFWDGDTLEEDRLGISTLLSSGEPAKVLISGGGDGALQDCLRVLTGLPSAKELYKTISSLPNVGPLLRWAESQILAAEDHAARWFQWGAKASHDHVVQEWLGWFYSTLIGKLKKSPAYDGLVAFCLELASRRYPRHVELLVSCTHFSQSYALNRFLVLLLQEAFRNDSPSGSQTVFVIRYAKRLEKVSPVDEFHSCYGSVAGCLGSRHRAMVSRGNCHDGLADPSAEHGGLSHSLYDLIVIRHGIDHKSEQEFAKGRRLRQLLPYHYVWANMEPVSEPTAEERLKAEIDDMPFEILSANMRGAASA